MASHKHKTTKTIRIADTRDNDILLVLTHTKRGKPHSINQSYHPSIDSAKLEATRYIGQYQYAIYNLNDPSATLLGRTYNKGIDPKLSKRSKGKTHHSQGDTDGTTPREVHNYKGSVPLHHICDDNCKFDHDGNIRNCRQTGWIRQGNKLIKRQRKVDFSDNGVHAFTSDILKRDKRKRLSTKVYSTGAKRINVTFEDNTQGYVTLPSENVVIRNEIFESTIPNQTLASELASHTLATEASHKRAGLIKREKALPHMRLIGWDKRVIYRKDMTRQEWYQARHDYRLNGRMLAFYRVMARLIITGRGKLTASRVSCSEQAR